MWSEQQCISIWYIWRCSNGWCYICKVLTYVLLLPLVGLEEPKVRFFANLLYLSICSMHMRHHSLIICDMVIMLIWFPNSCGYIQFARAKSFYKHICWRNTFCNCCRNTWPSPLCLAYWQHASKFLYLINMLLGSFNFLCYESLCMYLRIKRAGV